MSEQYEVLDKAVLKSPLLVSSNYESPVNEHELTLTTETTPTTESESVPETTSESPETSTPSNTPLFVPSEPLDFAKLLNVLMPTETKDMFSSIINKINTDANKNVLSLFDVILKKFTGEMPNLVVEESKDSEECCKECEQSEECSDCECCKESEEESDDVEETNEESDDVEETNEESDDVEETDIEDYEDDSESEEYEEIEVIYLIQRSDKKCKYVKTYTNAVKAMEKEVKFFLKNNLVSVFRMDKDENKIVLYERLPNSLNPFQETVLFEISIVRINKY